MIRIPHLMLLCIFVRHNFHDVLNATIQCCAYLQENLRGDMAVAAHLGDRCRADTCFCTQVFLFHILIDEQLPELFITDSHKMISSIPIYEKCSAAWQSIRFFAAILPRPIPTPDSVVYYDSTFSRTKQENDESTRFLVSNIWNNRVFANEGNGSISLFIAPQSLSCCEIRKCFPRKASDESSPTWGKRFCVLYSPVISGRSTPRQYRQRAEWTAFQVLSW